MIKKTRKISKPQFVIALLLVAGLIFIVLELTNTTHVFHKKTKVIVSTTTTAGETTKGEPQASQSSQTTPAADATTDDNKFSPVTSATLSSPSGNFVSNHHPNLSGSPAPSQMQSTCNTNSEAKCQITFTKGSTVKSLTAQTTDRGGAAYWTWNINDIGLTEGEWHIQAIATLGDKTATTDDSIALVVSP